MGKIKYITLIIVALLGLGALSSESGAAFLKPGMPAPNFLVQSGDNQKLSMDMIRGKVVVVFYESRDAIRKNIELKNELKRLFGAQPANVQNDIFRLVVVDCSSGAAFPVSLIWQSKLREASGKEGFTIFGDWNGKMFENYNMKAEESNFFIIDKKGIIRYVKAGKINPNQFGKIKKLLFTLVKTG
jgi:peroxiredoxin